MVNDTTADDDHAIEILADSREDECVKTFILRNEDHTLGNSLRWMLMQNPDVQFCGYTIPHPSQRELHLRLQTHKQPAVNVLRDGLQRLADLSDQVAEKVQHAADQFRAQHNQPAQTTS